MSDVLSDGDSHGAVSAYLERTQTAGKPANAAEPAVRALLDDLVADNPVIATALGLAAGADLALALGGHPRASLPTTGVHEA